MALLALTSRAASPRDMCVALSQLHTCAEGPEKDAWVQYAIEAMAAYRLKYADKNNVNVAGPHFVKAQTWAQLAAAFDNSVMPEHVLVAEAMLRDVFATIALPSQGLCKLVEQNSSVNKQGTASAKPQLSFAEDVLEAVETVARDADMVGLCEDADKLEDELDYKLLWLQQPIEQEPIAEVLGRVRSVLVEFISSDAFDAQKHRHVRKTFDLVDKKIKSAQTTHQHQAAASATQPSNTAK